MVVHHGHPGQSSGASAPDAVVTQPQPITRVLVANRGEIARRVFATCRRLGISTAAVYSDPDASAAFVAEADVAVPLGGASPAESYLRADALLDAARTSRRRRHPPGLRLPVRERRLRAVRDRGGADVDRPLARSDRRHGLQDRGARPHGARRRPRPARRAARRRGRRRAARDRRRHRLPPARQGVRRRRREGHAAGRAARRPRRGARGRPARGGVRVRRRHRVPRALRAARAPRRDPDRRRRARHRLRAARARLLGPAPPPEGDRGGAVARGHARRCARA